jgi:hypothetical protein
MSTATTVLASVAVVLGTLALLGFVLFNSASADAGDHYASFAGVPERFTAPDGHSDMAPQATAVPAESETEPSMAAPRGSPSTSTSDVSVLYSVTPRAQSPASDTIGLTWVRVAGERATTDIDVTFSGAPRKPSAASAFDLSGLPGVDGSTTSTRSGSVLLTTGQTALLGPRHFPRGLSDSATGPRDSGR